MDPRNEPKKSRFSIEKLEDRILFAHLGHEVVLPEAAGNASDTANQAIAAATSKAPDHSQSHHRALLLRPIIIDV